jgi:hypothetical protein
MLLYQKLTFEPVQNDKHNTNVTHLPTITPTPQPITNTTTDHLTTTFDHHPHHRT